MTQRTPLLPLVAASLSLALIATPALARETIHFTDVNSGRTVKLAASTVGANDQRVPLSTRTAPVNANANADSAGDHPNPVNDPIGAIIASHQRRR
jgi:hypothetical protein